MNDGRLLSILLVFIPVFIIWIGIGLRDRGKPAHRWVSALGWASLALLVVWLAYWIITN